MIKTYTLSGLLALAVTTVHAIAAADTNISPFEQSTLTGDWGGVRTKMADLGVSIDLSTTGYYSGLLSGDEDQGFEFGGRSDLMLHIDTDKLGLWDGGGFHFHLESRYGDATDRSAPRSGGLWPLNVGVVLPLGEANDIAASSIYYSHRFNGKASLLIGKINAVDLLANDPFFGGWARDRFTNIAYVAPPSGVVPPTIMGGIFNYRINPLTFTFMVFDPNDQTNEYWVDDLFQDGANFSMAATWGGEFAGRPSTVGLTATYSTAEGTDLTTLLLPPDLKREDKEGSFNVALSFSHLLIESSATPGKGLGIYGKAAIADGNPNPIQSSFVGGFAGHGIVPNRPNDVFGIGYYYYNFSDDLESSLSPALPIKDEQGVEIYYNIAVTPWLRITPDFQWIKPARRDFSDAWAASIRASILF